MQQFEKILEKQKDNYESMKILAWLYASTDSKTKTLSAIELLRQVGM